MRSVSALRSLLWFGLFIVAAAIGGAAYLAGGPVIAGVLAAVVLVAGGVAISAVRIAAQWQRAIVLSPNDSSFDRAMYRDALAIQDYKTAYAGVQAVLKLEPDAPDKKELKKLASQLKPLTQISSPSGSGGP